MYAGEKNDRHGPHFHARLYEPWGRRLDGTRHPPLDVGAMCFDFYAP